MNRTHKGIIATVIAVLLIAAAAYYVTQVYMPNSRYKEALSLKESSDYEGAIKAFETLGSYKDSADQIIECETAIKDADYAAALALKENGDYDAAISAFEALDSYKDSADQIIECETAIKDADYAAALALKENGDYDAAISAFEALDGHKDSADQIEECRTLIKDNSYDEAVELKNSGDFTGAITAFEALDGYRDSKKQIVLCRGMLESQVQEASEFGKSFRMELPDENWSVILDTNGVVVAVSEVGRIIVVHNDAAVQVLPESADAARLMEAAGILTDADLDAALEIIDYKNEEQNDTSVISYTVKYEEARKDGAAQRIVKDITANGSCYQITADLFTDDEAVVEKAVFSIDSFEITPVDTAAAARISGEQQ